MNESSAREVLLLQAFESVVPASPNWTAEDAAWATRLASQDAAAGAGVDAFIVARARHAMQRLLPREPAVAAWLARRAWRPRWMAWSALAGLALGLLADGIGSSQRINLLAPPVWTLVVWNLLVYALLIGTAASHVWRRPAARAAGLTRLVERLMRRGRHLPVGDARTPPVGGSGAALRSFAARWLHTSAPLTALRAATLLHAGAAALGLGVMGGMYARGLVLDYRAAWESTFLSASTVHAALATLLAPASWLSGIALPDAQSFAALRAVHGGADVGAPAAPWIHLYAWTLLIAVVGPRTVLATVGALRAQWRAGHVELEWAEPYFQRLGLQQRGDVARVQVLPYAQTPGPRAVVALQALLAEVLGDGVQLQVRATTAFGAEDDEVMCPTLPPGTTLVVALFDLTATPEIENHGRFLTELARRAPAGASIVLLVDDAAFTRRFGTTGSRLAQRREAWQRLAAAVDGVAAFVDLEAPERVSAVRDMQSAIASPVRGKGLR